MGRAATLVVKSKFFGYKYFCKVLGYPQFELKNKDNKKRRFSAQNLTFQYQCTCSTATHLVT